MYYAYARQPKKWPLQWQAYMKKIYYMLHHYRENSYRKNDEGDRNLKIFIYEDDRNICYR